MAAIIGTSSRTCAQLGKGETSVRCQANVRAPRASRRAFRGSRRSVKVSAADEAAPAPAAEQQAAAPAAPQQGRRERRPQRTVTVDLADVKPGDVFDATVTSVEAYGAFVNIGARTDGLVHVSQLTDGFVKNTADVVKVGDTVKVKVLTVDPAQSRLALSMKGMSPRGSGASSSRSSKYDDDDAVEEAEAEPLQDNEALFEGTFFRVEDVDEPIDEADEWEVEQDAEVAVSLALAQHDMVTGTVVQVEDFGVIMEFEAGGQKLQGLLHVSEMRAPATAVAAAQGSESDAADDSSAPDNATGMFGDEAEYLEEEYEDVGGVDKPSDFYKVGDTISAFVLDVEGEKKVSLTQFMSADEMPSALVDEDEDEADLLEQLDGEEPVDFYDNNDGEEDDSQAPALNIPAYEAASITAGVYYGMQRTYPERAMSGFISGKRDGSTVVPNAFPDRPVLMRDASARVPASNTNEDDDGEESELVDFWTDDAPLPKNVLKRLGYKISKDEAGEMEVVAREKVEGEEAEEENLYDLLNMADDADIDAIVDALLNDDEVEEAELPYLAARRPVVFAMSVETAATISAADVKRLRVSTGVGMMDCKKALTECDGDFDKATEWLRQKGLSGADKKAGRLAAEGVINTYIHPGSRLGVIVEVNCETDFVAASDAFQKLATEVCMVAASCDAVVVNVDDVPAELLAKEREVEMGKEDIKSKPEAVRAKIVEGRLEKIKRNFALTEQPALRDNNKTLAEIVKETIAQVGENIQIRRFEKFNLGEGLEKRSNDFAAEVAQQTQAKGKEDAKPKAAEAPKAKEAPKAAAPAVAISAAVVKQLRDKSGAGMMDCKKALAENGGDMEAASEWLRKKGLASADKKAGRLAAEGAIGAYIHPGSRLGVLLEINCETDFVAVSDQFRTLLKGVSMQIAASPSVQYVSQEDIPAADFAKEIEIEMGREDLQSKPEAIRSKIAEGRVKKMLQEQVLLEQPYLMDQDKTVAEAVKEAVATIGENIQIRRFVRFTLGEGLEKKVNDLAADVAAATGKQ